MFDFENAIKKAEATEGWIRPKERVRLYELASDPKAPEGCVVEIGSWKGKSTVLLACASKHLNRGKVYAVDPFGPPEGVVYKDEYNLWKQQKVFDTYADFLANIKKADVEDYVIPMRGTSEEIHDRWLKDPELSSLPIRFLWIDGCHDREFVQKDFDLWEPHLVVDGFVAFHDAWSQNKDFDRSAAIVAKNEVIDSPRFENGQLQSIIYGRKLS